MAVTKFLVVVYYESRICELASGTHHTYSGSDGTAVQRSSFEAEIFDGVATFEFQSTDSGEPARRWSFKLKAGAVESADAASSTEDQGSDDDIGGG